MPLAVLLCASLGTARVQAQSSPPPAAAQAPAPAPAKPPRVIVPAPAPAKPGSSGQAAPVGAPPPAAPLPPASGNAAPPPAEAPSVEAGAPPGATPLPPATEGYPSGQGYPAPAPAEPPGYYGSYASTEGAYDEAAPYDAGSRTHDGFFLRLSLGFGAGITGYRERVDGRKVSDVSSRGLAGLFGVSVGGAVMENLIIHGDLQGCGYGAATREVDGTRDARDKIDGSLVLLGGGVTYYFMPTNAYVTLIVGAASFTEQRDGEDALESGIGVGVSGLVGKEWWVGRSAEWGLGAALRTGFYTAPLDIAQLDSRVSAFDIGVVFGATYN